MKIKLRSRGWGLPLVIIAIPLALCIIYYLIFAVDRYESTTQVVVRQAGTDQSTQSAGLAILLSGANPASREETQYLSQFIQSMEMVQILDRELNWTAHYAEQKRDPFFLVDADAPQEDRLKFFRRMVTTHFDAVTGLLEIKVEALDPEFAQETLKLILATGEKLVNELSHRMGRDQVTFSQSELVLARQSYDDHKQKLLGFQTRNNLLNAESTAESRSKTIAMLEGEITTEKAILRGLQSTLSASAPQIRQKQTRIRSLEQQLAAETARLVDDGNDQVFNVIAAEFRNLQLDASIAEEIYRVAVNAVEAARIEASKNSRSLMVIVTPHLPDDPSYPRRLYNFGTVLLCLLMIYGITRFVLATIEDHRD